MIRNHDRQSSEKPRGAFTLVEVILVLGLIVTVTTMAVLSLNGGFRKRRLLKSADQIRTAWANARIDAIKTGRVQVFQHCLQGRRYYWVPQLSLDDPNANLWGATSTGIAAEDPPEQFVTPRELPKDVRFFGVNVRFDQRSSALLAETPEPEALAVFNDSGEWQDTQETTWGVPIYFFPDGTSSNAEFVLRNEADQFVSIYLRGLTGTSRVGRVADDRSNLSGGALR